MEILLTWFVANCNELRMLFGTQGVECAIAKREEQSADRFLLRYP
jgi:hypothetical protein